MSTVRVRREIDGVEKNGQIEQGSKSRIEFDLNKLEQQRIVATRVRPDTGVKQFHAG
jgi:hypothetical protein